MAHSRVELPADDWWQGPLLTELNLQLLQNRHHTALVFRCAASAPAPGETTGFKWPPWAFVGFSELEYKGSSPTHRIWIRGPGVVEWWDGT